MMFTEGEELIPILDSSRRAGNDSALKRIGGAAIIDEVAGEELIALRQLVVNSDEEIVFVYGLWQRSLHDSGPVAEVRAVRKRIGVEVRNDERRDRHIAA